MICKICNKNVDGYRGLSSHINKTHKISCEFYYIQFYKRENEDICPTCGKHTMFISIKDGYKKHCNQKCANNDPQILKTKRETCIAKFGVSSYMKTQKFREKAVQAILSDETKNKRKQTMLNKYGNEYAISSEEVRQKCKSSTLKHFGVECIFQSKEVQSKIKETLVKKYNITNPYNIPHVQEKANSKESREKMKQTCLNHYGVESPLQSSEVRHKIVKSMKKNGNYSSFESLLEKELKQHNIKYEIQYNKSEKYPFHADFYLTEKDIFVEINGYWHHGHHWFDENNKADIETLNNWIEKSKTKPQYKTAINVWTNYDLKKREFAKKNNLNYVVLWSKNDIIDWVNSNFEIRKDF